MVCGVFNDGEGDAGFTGGCVETIQTCSLYCAEKWGYVIMVLGYLPQNIYTKCAKPVLESKLDFRDGLF